MVERRIAIRIISAIFVCVVVLGVAIGLLIWGLGTRVGDVNEEHPVVSTNLGSFRGVRVAGRYSKFLGIPYAVVDENNVFGRARPHPGFEDVFDANDDSTFCVQLTLSGELAGTIQCLHLHIYVPDTPSSQNRLPVMAHFHGGGFTQGTASGEYPKTLVQNDVIVVSIGYRLGVYGFLCLDTPEVPGNQGFKDQILALWWIKENIEAFGGDPTSVTIFGQSAGGMSVNAHLYSNYEKLFDKAIIQSGPALSVRFFVPSYKNAPLELAEYLGLNTTDINDALSYLATVDPISVTAAAYELQLISATGADGTLIKPCIEKKFDGVENFITEHPINVKAAPKVNYTSIMIGYTDEEFGLEFYPPPQDGNYDNFEYILYFGFNRDEALDGAVNLIKKFYVGDERNFGINVRQETANYAGDLVFNYPSQRMAQQFVESGAKAVYRYVFSYIGDKNVTGASHGAELQFLFDKTQFSPTTDKNENEQRLTEQMTKLWSNFAKYGNPTPEVTELLPVEWKPITKTRQFSLDINLELTLKSRPEQQRMTFWDLFYRAYKKYEIGYKADTAK